MNWREELSYLAKRKPWRDVLRFLKKTVAENPDNAEVYVAAIYYLVDLILEGPIDKRIDFVREADEIALEIKDLFNRSYERFNENVEYLFFVGYFMELMDWYFGDDILKISRQMGKKAFRKEPENTVYKWGVMLISLDPTSQDLADLILSDSKRIEWLKSKGAAGEYIIEALKTKLDSSVLTGPAIAVEND